MVPVRRERNIHICFSVMYITPEKKDGLAFLFVRSISYNRFSYSRFSYNRFSYNRFFYGVGHTGNFGYWPFLLVFMCVSVLQHNGWFESLSVLGE